MADTVPSTATPGLAPSLGKHPGGRPPIYGEEILAKAREYLSLCEDKPSLPEEYREPQPHGGELMRQRRSNVKIPTKGGLAVFLGVRRETLYAWADEHEEFSNIMEELGSEQEDRLIQKGLSGEYNPTIAKVLLTKHGYVDKQEVTGKDGKDLVPAPILDLTK